MINVISKRPQDYSFGSVTAEYGSYDRKQLSVDVGGARRKMCPGVLSHLVVKTEPRWMI